MKWLCIQINFVLMERKELNNIAEALLLDCCKVKDIGLYQGKMGIVLFFYHYSRFSNNDLYRIFADELLDDILCDLDSNSDISFYYGLSGIAWGICHLYINHFVTCDIVNILEDVNQEIVKKDIKRMDDSSLSMGIKGILFYIKLHLLASSTNPLGFDDSYMDAINSITPEQEWMNDSCCYWDLFLSDLELSPTPWQKGLCYLLKH